MRMFLATLGSEIDSFSPIPTTLETFEVCCLLRPPMDDHEKNWAAAPQLVFRRLARAAGYELIESLCAHAMPAGVPSAALYEGLRDEILTDLARAGEVDAVLYHLHGALIAEGYDDCEADLLARTRAIVGADVPIGAVFDLHAHLTPEMVASATVLVGLKEYPHIDYVQRSEELFELICACVRGEIKPTMALFDCRMIGVIHTTRQPMRDFVDDLIALERSDHEVLSLTLSHGFASGDVPSMGASMLAITDNNQTRAQRLAEQLGKMLFDMRAQVVSNYLSIEQGIERARRGIGTGKPVVIADVNDNAGGGAPSDKTFVLTALIESGIRNAALAYLWDPKVVRLAQSTGVGGRLSTRIGGNTPISGEPVRVDAEVIALRSNFHQHGYGSDALIYVGDCALIHFDGIDVVLSSEREQPLSLDAFIGFGIAPETRDVLVVKSTQHFYADFAPVAHDVVYVNPYASGTPASELLRLDYKNISRPKWPFDQEPFA